MEQEATEIAERILETVYVFLAHELEERSPGATTKTPGHKEKNPGVLGVPGGTTPPPLRQSLEAVPTVFAGDRLSGLR